jgi:hypothetical protein
MTPQVQVILALVFIAHMMSILHWLAKVPDAEGPDNSFFVVAPILIYILVAGISVLLNLFLPMNSFP